MQESCIRSYIVGKNLQIGLKRYKFIENSDFIKHDNFIKVANLKRPQIDYYLTIDMAKELSMVENNEMDRKIRRYFIEVERRYKEIVETPQNMFDFMRLAINQIETNEKEIQNIKVLTESNLKEIEMIKSRIDVVIKKEYCLA